MPLKTACLDPGHGGRDPGACGFIVEKEYTLKLALKTQNALVRNYQGVSVVMTRINDSYVALADRCSIANRAGSDCFVSFHINDGPAGANGFESFVLPNANRAKVLQQEIHKAVAPFLMAYHHITPALSEAEEVEIDGVEDPRDEEIEAQFKDRGRKFARFYVLANTLAPAVLLECGFVNSARDVALLQDGAFVDEFTGKIAEGIAAFLNLERKRVWNPQEEIDRLLQRGIINTPRQPSVFVQWGEFATVVNRILDKMEGRT